MQYPDSFIKSANVVPLSRMPFPCLSTGEHTSKFTSSISASSIMTYLLPQAESKAFFSLAHITPYL